MIEVPAAVAPSAAVRSTMMPVLFVLLQLAVSVRSSPDSLQSFTKRLTDHDRTKWNRQLQKEETKHALWSTFQEQETSRHGRGLLARQLDEDLGYMLCDGALTQCLEHSKCLDCFAKMSEQDIDWATMPDNLECRDVLNVIYDKGHCNAMAVDKKAESAFCVSFQACVKPQHEKQQQHPAMANATTLDCSSLVRCEWPGMHEQFLGDGICHENLYGCYNSAVCGWDKGDCCPDSCHEDNNQIHCGMEGYACRDPLSRDCNNALSVDCGENKDWVNNNDDEIYAGGGDSIEFACPKIDEEPYRLTMYDSFGDGWEETKLILTNKDTKKQVFEGGLKNGAQGTAFVCLSAKPACYTVTTKGGIWGKEVSWELKPYRTVGAAPAIASGGAPMTCEFAAYGTSCDTTCNGRTTEDPTKDSDYTEFKAMFECVTKKCPIQVKSCQSDEMCDACLEKEDFTPTYCFGMDSFNAVVDCALCACTDDSKTDYCMSREGSSGGKASSNNNQASDGNSEYAICSPTQTMAGSDAILEFSQCTKFDEVSMLLMDFDQNHFGDLDTFEKCAHEYRDRVNHGGHTAQECMSILNRAKDGQSSVQVEDPGLAESIQALARIVYEDGENFCDCATQANKDCPLCSSFLNFKTLLYESVDACNALDKIDCAAWNEFYTPCRSNLIKKFTNADLSQSKQCDFVLKEDCGGAGTFPSFRRLDCEANLEVTHESWQFYLSLKDNCLKDGAPTPSSPSARTPPPTKNPTKAPVPSPPSGGYSPSSSSTTSGTSQTRNEYIPPEKRGKNNKNNNSNNNNAANNDNNNANEPADQDAASTPEDEPSAGSTGDEETPKKKKKSHFFRNVFVVLLLGVGGYYYFKRYGLTLDGCEGPINFVGRLIRRIRGGGGGGGGFYNGGGGSDAMYTGLAMESSTSFEPAFLPPAPSAVDPGGNPNAMGSGNYYI